MLILNVLTRITEILRFHLPTILSGNSLHTSYPNSSSSAVSIIISSSIDNTASVCISSYG